MRWGAYIKRTAVRRVVWIVAGLAVYALLGFLSDVYAQSAQCHLNGDCTRQEAYAAAQVISDAAAAMCTNGGEPLVRGPFNTNTSWPFYQPAFQCYDRQGNLGPFTNRSPTQYFPADDECPAGTQWRDDLKRCFDESECQARNQEEGFLNVGSVVKPFSSRCIAGCRYSSSDAQCSTVSGSVQQQCTGTYQWGASCTADPPGPDEPFIPSTYETPEGTAEEAKKEQRCIPVSGQNVCLKKNGEVCYSSATTGRQFCWRTTETGEKNDSQTRQIRRAGETEIPPANPNLPSGDVLEKSGQSVTTTTTGSNFTSTTTTTNYVTQHGTQPGPGNDSEPDDGSGKEPGEGDDDKGSVDGGGDCEAPPIVRGGDPVVAAVVDQTWATRCAVEAGNAAKVTGDVADCASPFSVEGDNANAVKLRAMREQICHDGAIEAAQAADGAQDAELGDWSGEFGTNIFAGGQGHEGAIGEGEGIVTNRYGGGGGSCPQISVEIPGLGTWEPPAAWCSLLQALRLLFIAVATVWALRIIGS